MATVRREWTCPLLQQADSEPLDMLRLLNFIYFSFSFSRLPFFAFLVWVFFFKVLRNVGHTKRMKNTHAHQLP